MHSSGGHLRESREAARDFLDEGDFKNAAREFLFQAEFELDSALRAGDLRVAQVCATLAHTDALKEATQAMREARDARLRRVA